MADNVFNLDEVRAAHIEANPTLYRTLRLYDRDWRVRETPNAFALLGFIDGGGIGGQIKFLTGFIHADEREGFVAALEADEYLDENLLGKIIDYLTGNLVGKDGENSSTSEQSPSPSGENSTVPSPLPVASDASL